MKKHFLFLLFLPALPIVLPSQEVVGGICIQVQASAGGSGQIADRDFAWTLGETMIATYDLALSQGFHQPECGGDFSVSAPEPFFDGQIRVFPNPTSGFLSISISQGHLKYGNQLQASVFDLYGQLAMQLPLFTIPVEEQIDCSFLPAGVWLLRFQDPHTKRSMVFKFLKLD